MGADVDVCLLGSLRVVRAGVPVEVSSPKQRALLAELALSPGRPVLVATLVQCVWGDAPPARARAALHTLTARLRRLLGNSAVRTAPDGYLLDVEPDRVDVSRFLRLLGKADRTPDSDTRRMALRAALALWQGEPVFGDRVPGLVERYLLAVQQMVDLDLEAAVDTGLLAELTDLLARYPLHEPLWERAIRVLAAAGRTAEALAAYAECRRTLADELGVEPGAPLRRLHQDLLATDRPAEQARLVRRQELPRDIGHFTGRAEEIHQLMESARLAPRSAVAISAIDGMAGVGKTTLAVRAARLLAEDYPDGQLWLDLHAHTPDRQPMTPAAALDRLLRGIGMPGEQVPKGLDERAALWRTRLADQRILIVLDNALDTDQVRPLLPGGTGCLVLVTSRRRLAGLDGAHVMSLDVLPEAAAVQLFERIVGDSRPALRPAATVETVNLCGRLPLAVRIAASRLRHRPAWTVERLAAKLRDQEHRLVELSTGDVHVARVLGLSYRQLDEDLSALFLALGAHPGGDLDARAAAALARLSPGAAEARLQQLVDVNLLSEHPAGRYQMHDLVRAYATRLAGADHAGQARARLADHYLHSAVAAMDLAYPYERHRRLRRAHPTAAHPAELTSRESAINWLAAECANLIAVAMRVDTHTVPIALVIAPYLSRVSRNDEAFALHRSALAITQRDRDQAGEVRVLNRLSEASWRTGRLAEATEHCGRARDLARTVGDLAGEAHAMRLAGAAQFRTGERARAAEAYRSAIVLAQEAGDLVLEGEAWINLAAVAGAGERHAEAYECARRAMANARACGDPYVEALAMGSLGHACVERGDHHQAIGYLTEAVAAGERHEFPKLCAHALHSLALAHQRLGDRVVASDRYRTALDLARRIGAPEIECVVLMDLGGLALASGDTDTAVAWRHQAVAAANRFGEPFRMARAHDGLGDAHHAFGDTAAAAEQWRAALRIYDDTESGDGGPIRDKLARERSCGHGRV